MNPAELLAALRPQPSDGLSSITLRRQQLLLLESLCKARLAAAAAAVAADATALQTTDAIAAGADALQSHGCAVASAGGQHAAAAAGAGGELCLAAHRQHQQEQQQKAATERKGHTRHVPQVTSCADGRGLPAPAGQQPLQLGRLPSAVCLPVGGAPQQQDSSVSLGGQPQRDADTKPAQQQAEQGTSTESARQVPVAGAQAAPAAAACFEQHPLPPLAAAGVIMPVSAGSTGAAAGAAAVLTSPGLAPLQLAAGGQSIAPPQQLQQGDRQHMHRVGHQVPQGAPAGPWEPQGQGAAPHQEQQQQQWVEQGGGPGGVRTLAAAGAKTTAWRTAARQGQLQLSRGLHAPHPDAASQSTPAVHPAAGGSGSGGSRGWGPAMHGAGSSGGSGVPINMQGALWGKGPADGSPFTATYEPAAVPPQALPQEVQQTPLQAVAGHLAGASRANTAAQGYAAVAETPAAGGAAGLGAVSTARPGPSGYRDQHQQQPQQQGLAPQQDQLGPPQQQQMHHVAHLGGNAGMAALNATPSAAAVEGSPPQPRQLAPGCHPTHRVSNIVPATPMDAQHADAWVPPSPVHLALLQQDPVQLQQGYSLPADEKPGTGSEGQQQQELLGAGGSMGGGQAADGMGPSLEVVSATPETSNSQRLQATAEDHHLAAAGNCQTRPHAATMLQQQPQQQQQQQQVAAVPRAPLQPLQLQGPWDQPRSSTHKPAWGSGVVQQGGQPPSTAGEGGTGGRRLPRLQPLTPLPMADLEGSPSPSPPAHQQQQPLVQPHHHHQQQQQQQQQVEGQQAGAVVQRLPPPLPQMKPAVAEPANTLGAPAGEHPAAAEAAAADTGVAGGKLGNRSRRRKLPKLHPLCSSGRPAGEAGVGLVGGSGAGAGDTLQQLQQAPDIEMDVDRQQRVGHCIQHSAMQQQHKQQQQQGQEQQQVASVVTMAPGQELLRLELGEQVLNVQVAGSWVLLVTSCSQPQQAHAGDSIRPVRLHLLHWVATVCNAVPPAPMGKFAGVPHRTPPQQHQQQATDETCGTSGSSSSCGGLSLAAVAWGCLDVPSSPPGANEGPPLVVHLLPVAVHPAAAPATGGAGHVSAATGAAGHVSAATAPVAADLGGVLVVAAGMAPWQVGARQDQDAPQPKLCVYHMSAEAAGPCTGRPLAMPPDALVTAAAQGVASTGPAQGSHLRCVQEVACSSTPTAVTSCTWALAAGGVGASISCWALPGYWCPAGTAGHTTATAAAAAAAPGKGLRRDPMAWVAEPSGCQAVPAAAAGTPGACSGGPLLEPVQLLLPGGHSKLQGRGLAAHLVSSVTSSHVAAMCFCGAPLRAAATAGTVGRTRLSNGLALGGLLLVAATSAGALCVWDVGRQQLLHHTQPFAGLPRQLLPLPWACGEGLAARGWANGSGCGAATFVLLAAVQRAPSGMSPQGAQWQAADAQQPRAAGAGEIRAVGADLAPIMIKLAVPAGQEQHPCEAVIAMGRPYPVPSGIVAAAAAGAGAASEWQAAAAGVPSSATADARQRVSGISSMQLAALLPDDSLLIWDAAASRPARSVKVAGSAGAGSVATRPAAASAGQGNVAGGTQAAGGQLAWLGPHHVLRVIGDSIGVIGCSVQHP